MENGNIIIDIIYVEIGILVASEKFLAYKAGGQLAQSPL